MGAPDWRAAVRIQPEPLRESDLLARLAQGTSESAVWVTDLLDPRPAFYRRRVRVPVSPERRARQASGRQLHALIGSALAAPGVLEVRVRREGVVGQIDLLEKEPTELKTTESLPDPGTLRSSRASYLDQLGLYGALTGRDRGRLVVVEVVEGAPRRCQVYLVRFRAASELLDEMRRRARAFRAADEQNTPRDLPRCAWFGRGCEFQEARACECRGDEAPASDAVVGCVESIDLSEPLGLALEARLRSLAGVDVPATIERFRDLLYPRRAYFERVMPPAEGPEPAPVRLAEPPPDLYREIMDALEGSGSDELSRVPVPTGEPLERVSCLDGRPFLLKVTRFPRPYAAGELLERQPQYLLELGFRCALVGADSGWLFVGYDRVAAHRDRLRIYRVEFSPLETFSDLAMDRIEGIARAVREGRPEALPACPSWMYSGCPYRERCGCGVPGGPG